MLLTCFITRTYSQNIYSALQHDSEEEIRGRIPVEIIEENIFITPTGREVKRNKKRLNELKHVLSEERYNQEGKLEARLAYSYDSSGRHSLTRRIERWTNFGYTSETAFYEYDSSWFLIRVTDKTDKGNTIQETVLTNNAKGHPVKLALFDGNGNSYGYELASYDYEANKAYTEVQNSKGILIGRDTLTIKFETRTDSKCKYNDHGDIIESPKYFYEYKYDEFGNWITMRIFDNVRGRKKSDRVFNRRFEYGD